ncbi:MAG: hypothetical protein WBQ89_10100 [Candidatus Acidiferrum sp.]
MRAILVGVLLALMSAASCAQTSKWPLLVKIVVSSEHVVTVSIVDRVNHTETLFTEWTGDAGLPKEIVSASPRPARLHKEKLEIPYTAQGKPKVYTIHRAFFFSPPACLSYLGC